MLFRDVVVEPDLGVVEEAFEGGALVDEVLQRGPQWAFGVVFRFLVDCPLHEFFDLRAALRGPQRAMLLGPQDALPGGDLLDLVDLTNEIDGLIGLVGGCSERFEELTARVRPTPRAFALLRFRDLVVSGLTVDLQDPGRFAEDFHRRETTSVWTEAVGDHGVTSVVFCDEVLHESTAAFVALLDFE